MWIWILLVGFSLSMGIMIIYFYCYRSKGILRIKDLQESKERFLSSVHGKKTLISGGSDVLFSCDTEKMNRELHQTYVNLGLNVGLGMGYLLDYTKQNLSKGDRVILSLAYSLYSNPPYHIFAFEYYRMYQKSKILLHFSPIRSIYYFFGNWKLNLAFKLKAFQLSESGNYQYITGSCLEEKKNKPLEFPEIFKKTPAILKLEAFKTYCDENNIQVLITYPATLEFHEYKESQYLKDLTTYLEENYEVIGKFTDFLYKEELIYNSVYHVNSLGQAVHTEKLMNNERMRNHERKI